MDIYISQQHNNNYNLSNNSGHGNNDGSGNK